MQPSVVTELATQIATRPKPLKYLFTATYLDGTVLQQTPDDVSTQDPKRSAYFDVDQERLWTFVLTDGDRIFGVDLQTGAFMVQGVPFFMHEGELPYRLKLIFFRRHTHDFNLEFKELAHEVVYRVGWKSYDSEGRSIERVMEVQ